MLIAQICKNFFSFTSRAQGTTKNKVFLTAAAVWKGFYYKNAFTHKITYNTFNSGVICYIEFDKNNTLF